MRTHRRFGAFHSYPKQAEAIPFQPTEVDPLIIEGISTELSPTRSDKTRETQQRAWSDDKTGESVANSLKQFGEDFHRNCGKSLWKSRVLKLQVSDNFRLLAFCTLAQQNLSNRSLPVSFFSCPEASHQV